MSVPYKIVTTDRLSASGASFEEDAASAILPYKVPKSKRHNAPAEFLGYVQENPNSTTSMTRTLPQRHPDWPWLWARRLNIYGVGAGLKEPSPTGELIDYYEHYVFNVGYDVRPYPVLPDHEIAKESDRFVEKLQQPRIEFLSIAGNTYKFNASQNPVSAPIPFKIIKTDIIYVWHAVSHKYLFDANGVATNINGLVGKLNNAEWEGYAAETLLLDAAEITPQFLPVRPKFYLGYQTDEFPPIVWKVTFNFIHFEEGWQKYPEFTKTQALRWDTIKNITTGENLYQTGNFDKLFEKAE